MWQADVDNVSFLSASSATGQDEKEGNMTVISVNIFDLDSNDKECDVQINNHILAIQIL